MSNQAWAKEEGSMSFLQTLDAIVRTFSLCIFVRDVDVKPVHQGLCWRSSQQGRRRFVSHERGDHMHFLWIVCTCITI